MYSAGKDLSNVNISSESYYINNIHHHHGNIDFKNDEKSFSFYNSIDEKNDIDINSHEKKRVKNEIRNKNVLELKVFYSIFKNEINIYYLLIQSNFMRILNQLLLVIIKSKDSNTTQTTTSTSLNSHENNTKNKNKNTNFFEISNNKNNLTAISTSISDHSRNSNRKNSNLMSPTSMPTTFTSTYKSITFLNNNYDYNDNNNINNNNINNKKIKNNTYVNRGIDITKNIDIDISEDYDVDFPVDVWVKEVLSYLYDSKDCCILEQLLLLSSPQV